MNVDQILVSISDNDEASAIEVWAEDQTSRFCSISADVLQSDNFFCVCSNDVNPSTWQRFVNSALLADWLVYVDPADRVDYHRLKRIMEMFPAGFRVWFLRITPNEFVPVGYTGWYPLAKNLFLRAYDHPNTITHRGELIPTTVIIRRRVYLVIQCKYCSQSSEIHSESTHVVDTRS